MPLSNYECMSEGLSERCLYTLIFLLFLFLFFLFFATRVPYSQLTAEYALMIKCIDRSKGRFDSMLSVSQSILFNQSATAVTQTQLLLCVDNVFCCQECRINKAFQLYTAALTFNHAIYEAHGESECQSL